MTDDSPRLAIYVFTVSGLTVALKLAGPLGAHVYAPVSLMERDIDLPPGLSFFTFSSLSSVVAEIFHTYSGHIFIAASGIAVRSVAPHLLGKHKDPAVLVIDQQGRFAISLLSGHLGGANYLARRVAAILEATPVITTATDIEDLPSIDVAAKQAGLACENPEAAKAVSAALLAGDTVFLHDPDNRLGFQGSRFDPLFQSIETIIARGPPDAPSAGSRPPPEQRILDAAVMPVAGKAPQAAAIIVTERALALDQANRQRCLLLHPRLYSAGVGCKRGTSASRIIEAVHAALAKAGVARGTLACLASLDVKTDEPGLVQAARRLDVPLRFYDAGELAAFPVTKVSAKAREVFGVLGVAEPAALAAAGGGNGSAALVAAKEVFSGVTVALARRVE
ncbi:MAG: cobalamin biosynthesis protein [Desulfovibrio sp.]|jgi:cobalamin biosynthesis protein CbiG|nr:cobalamin biosynthesis protein [Desulfovibrio sp.]